MFTIFNPKYFIYGLLLGAAGTMPGLSGGSVALVLGIYERLINSLANLKPKLLVPLLKKRAWKNILIDLDGAFLGLLLAGKAGGIFTFSLFIPYLVEHYPYHMNALFFGLMVASIPHVFRNFEQTPRLHHWLIMIVVMAATVFLTTLKGEINLSGFIFQFACGALALIAMLLPGISGSFVLVLLGNYQYIFTQINRLFFFDSNAFLNLIPFGLGALVGVIIFITIIKYCLAFFRRATLAVLSGLMLGSLPALWPFATHDNGLILLPHSFGFNEIIIITLFIIGLIITTTSLRAFDK